MTNLVVLISGRGSNMAALVRACRDERWAASIRAVVADRADAAGIELARQLGVPVEVVPYRDFDTRDAFEAALTLRIDRYEPQWIVLAGFMRVLTARFLAHFGYRVVNIHPSLLPAFPGLHTHRRVLQAGAHTHGATVHLVTDALDHGPIIAQAALAVRAGEDEASLAARVLALEHSLYPAALRWLIHGHARTVHDRVEVERMPDAPASTVRAA